MGCECSQRGKMKPPKAEDLVESSNTNFHKVDKEVAQKKRRKRRKSISNRPRTLHQLRPRRRGGEERRSVKGKENENSQLVRIPKKTTEDPLDKGKLSSMKGDPLDLLGDSSSDNPFSHDQLANAFLKDREASMQRARGSMRQMKLSGGKHLHPPTTRASTPDEVRVYRINRKINRNRRLSSRSKVWRPRPTRDPSSENSILKENDENSNVIAGEPPVRGETNVDVKKADVDSLEKSSDPKTSSDEYPRSETFGERVTSQRRTELAKLDRKNGITHKGVMDKSLFNTLAAGKGLTIPGIGTFEIRVKNVLERIVRRKKSVYLRVLEGDIYYGNDNVSNTRFLRELKDRMKDKRANRPKDRKSTIAIVFADRIWRILRLPAGKIGFEVFVEKPLGGGKVKAYKFLAMDHVAENISEKLLRISEGDEL